MMSRWFAYSALCLLATAATTSAEANDRSVRALMIPASACQIVENTPFEANPFKGPDTINRRTPGTYSVLCPLPINNIEMSGTASDNDITSFRIAYVDGDGNGPATTVEVILRRTDLRTPGSVLTRPVCQWNSNVNGSPGLISAIVPCAHDVLGRNFYTFNVILSTTSDSTQAYFYGIDFP
jgi:hypothetical protein